MSLVLQDVEEGDFAVVAETQYAVCGVNAAKMANTSASAPELAGD